MTEHSFGCLSDQEAMGLHDLSKAQVYQKPKGEAMFEKEAEEICSKYFEENCRKKNKWADTHDLVAMWQDGYNKANEWHYVKDGDYPKDNKPVLCILGDIDSDSYEVGYYNNVGSGEPWHFETYHLPDDDGDNAWGVSAWKEIVLPELKESE